MPKGRRQRGKGSKRTKRRDRGSAGKGSAADPLAGLPLLPRSSGDAICVIGDRQLRDAGLYADAAPLREGGGNPNPRRVASYSSGDNVLIVGSGDFTFAAALASSIGGGRLYATSLDSRAELREKYAGVDAVLAQLRDTGATVQHGVDATALNRQDWLLDAPLMSRIIFNFPHVGGGTAEDVAANAAMLRAFFFSARPFLAPGGLICVTLRDTPFYRSWKLLSLADAAGFRQLRKVPFEADDFAGYKPRRTHPAAVREAPSADEAFTHVFVLKGKRKRGREEDDDQREPARLHGVGEEEEEEEVKRGDDGAAAGERRGRAAGGRDRPERKRRKKQQRFNCDVCKQKMRTQAKYNAHMNSPKHAKAAKAAKKKLKMMAGVDRS